MAPQPLRGHRGVVHRLHRLHAGDAVPAALHPPARRHRRRRDRDVDRASASASRRRSRRCWRPSGDGSADRVRPQDHGRALARQLRRRDGGDGVRHARRGTSSRCARSRGCSPATARLSLTMAAESAPREQMAVGDRHRCRRRSGSVRRSARSSAALLAALVGLRRAFLVTAVFYVVGARRSCSLLYDDARDRTREPGATRASPAA